MYLALYEMVITFNGVMPLCIHNSVCPKLVCIMPLCIKNDVRPYLVCIITLKLMNQIWSILYTILFEKNLLDNEANLITLGNLYTVSITRRSALHKNHYSLNGLKIRQYSGLKNHNSYLPFNEVMPLCLKILLI